MPKRARISALDAALCVLRGYAIAKGVELPKRAASRSILFADTVFAILLGYAIGKNKLSLIAQDADEPDWITLENGTHIPVEKGQTKKEATEQFLSRKEAENAQKQATRGSIAAAPSGSSDPAASLGNPGTFRMFTRSSSSGKIRRPKPLRLSHQEFKAVTSGINTVYKAKYAHKVGETCGIFHKNHYYRFENYGFNNYRFVRRIPIIGNEDRIKRYEAEYK